MFGFSSEFEPQKRTEMPDLSPRKREQKATRKREKPPDKVRQIQARNQERDQAGKFSEKLGVFSWLFVPKVPTKLVKIPPEKRANSSRKTKPKTPIYRLSFWGKARAVFSGKWAKYRRNSARKHSQILQRMRQFSPAKKRIKSNKR